MSAGVLNLYSLARIGEKRSTAWALYLSDGLGAIRQATEGDGAVTSSRRWTPFGPALSEVEGVEVGMVQAGLGYTAEWSQPYTQFAYLRARWNDPSMSYIDCFLFNPPLEICVHSFSIAHDIDRPLQ
jgi:hypothetical protein